MNFSAMFVRMSKYFRPSHPPFVPWPKWSRLANVRVRILFNTCSFVTGSGKTHHIAILAKIEQYYLRTNLAASLRPTARSVWCELRRVPVYYKYTLRAGILDLTKRVNERRQKWHAYFLRRFFTSEHSKIRHLVSIRRPTSRLCLEF